MTDRTGIWLYAVTGASAPDLPAGLCGVAGEVVRTLPCHGLTAVVGSVDLAVFGEEPLKRALAEPARVERLALAHHLVIDAIARAAPTAPFRLATIYLGADRVRTFVDAHRAEFAEVLRRVTGRAEWGVRAYVDRRASTDATAGAPTGGTDEAPGTTYLIRRRRQLLERQNAWADAVARGAEVHRALAGLAELAVAHPIAAAEQSETGERLVLNASYLVDHAATASFAATARALSGVAGTRVALTGPWAAYSFTEVDPRTPVPDDVLR